MKSPFAILLVVVALVGVGIGIAAIVFLAPSEPDGDDDAIPVAQESELPTPSIRTELSNSSPAVESTPVEQIAVSSSVDVQEISPEEAAELEERIANDEIEGMVVTTVEVAREGGRGGFGGGGFAAGGGAGGPGGGNFAAIQEVMESNPEIAELIQKAQTGEMSQEDQQRLRELMQEALADAGFAPPEGAGRGDDLQPVQGTISEVSSTKITLQPSDEDDPAVEVAIDERTSITIFDELATADLSEGQTVAGTVQRGDGGKINIVSLSVVPDVPGGGFGFRGGGGANFLGGGDTSISNIQGRVSTVEDAMVHVETEQGTLRLTVNDDSVIVSTSTGSVSDLEEGMSAIAIGVEQEGVIQARNIVVGPESLIGSDAAGFPRGTGPRGQGQGG